MRDAVGLRECDEWTYARRVSCLRGLSITYGCPERDSFYGDKVGSWVKPDEGRDEGLCALHDSNVRPPGS